MGKLFWITCAFVGLALTMPAQQPLEQLEFYYIENSDPDKNGALTGSQLEDLEKRLIALTESSPTTGVLIFLSDKRAPVIYREKVGLDSIISRLSQKVVDYPLSDELAELERVGNILIGPPLVVQKHITLHYYLTDYFASSLSSLPNKVSYLTALFPTDLLHEIGTEQCEATVILHLSSSNRPINTQAIQQILNFCKLPIEGISAPPITYEVVMLP